MNSSTSPMVLIAMSETNSEQKSSFPLKRPSPDVENHGDHRQNAAMKFQSVPVASHFQPQIVEVKSAVAIDVEHLPEAYGLRITFHHKMLKSTPPQV